MSRVQRDKPLGLKTFPVRSVSLCLPSLSFPTRRSFMRRLLAKVGDRGGKKSHLSRRSAVNLNPRAPPFFSVVKAFERDRFARDKVFPLTPTLSHQWRGKIRKWTIMELAMTTLLLLDSGFPSPSYAFGVIERSLLKGGLRLIKTAQLI